MLTGAEPGRDSATGELVRTPESGLVLVLIPRGTFWMGAQRQDPAAPHHDPDAVRDEGPVRQVILSPFFLSKYEMTQGQWLHFTGANPARWKPAERRGVSLAHPVEQVSWNECVALLEHVGLQLPSEAQWEYACRAGSEAPYSFGRTAAEAEGHANLRDESYRRTFINPGICEPFDDGHYLTAPAGTYLPNGFGLHDVHGNVWEWCRDVYEFRFYARGGRFDPVNDYPGARRRIVRGGCFEDTASIARAAYRSYWDPDHADGFVGLRPARELEFAE